MEVIDAALSSRGDVVKTEFKIRFSNRASAQVNELQHVLSFDNGPKKYIIGLEISADAYPSTENEGSEPSSVAGVGVTFNDDGIAYAAEAHDIKWSNHIFAGVDEQIERTLRNELPYRISRVLHAYGGVIGLALGAVGVMAGLAITVLSTVSEKRIGRLSSQQVAELQAAAANLSGRIEDEVHYIRGFIEALYMPAAETGAASKFAFLLSWKIGIVSLLAIGLPLLAIYCMFKYYSSSYYEWGDMLERYKQIQGRRSFIWGTVIVGFILNIVTALVLAAAGL